MIFASSNRGGRSYEVRCDGCHVSFDADTGSFQGALSALKARGWRTLRNPPPEPVEASPGGFPPPPISVTEFAKRPDWLHFCSGCQSAKSQALADIEDRNRRRQQPGRQNP